MSLWYHKTTISLHHRTTFCDLFPAGVYGPRMPAARWKPVHEDPHVDLVDPSVLGPPLDLARLADQPVPVDPVGRSGRALLEDQLDLARPAAPPDQSDPRSQEDHLFLWDPAVLAIPSDQALPWVLCLLMGLVDPSVRLVRWDLLVRVYLRCLVGLVYLVDLASFLSVEVFYTSMQTPRS